ncbi:MAG: hypothetical protein JNN30_05095 [Rhodanobacteraceae bacterium]|nr:hypothetical protein [Rhodanobacteraceae bacterium]
MENDKNAIQALTARFFAVFDNRRGRAPSAEEFTGIFAPGAVIASHREGEPTLSSPREFVLPRIDLLRSGALVNFHEWETSAETEVSGTLAVRRTRYEKKGLLHGAPYGGTGTKHFQFTKLAGAWLILAISWVDDVN